MSVMSLTYRKAVRGLIKERGGLKMNAPDVYCKIHCISSLKVTINHISKDVPNAVKTDMIAALSGGGEIHHPTLFLNLRYCKAVPGSARGIVGDVRRGTHNPP